MSAAVVSCSERSPDVHSYNIAHTHTPLNELIACSYSWRQKFTPVLREYCESGNNGEGKETTLSLDDPIG